jgi:glycerol-3-phosphate dehydrogenase
MTTPVPSGPANRRKMSNRRQHKLAELKDDNRFDVIVVGGGVNGIGVYRELSLQGVRVLLIEKNDFCSGCSAAPSRMIHGGLRYLENGEFDLVKESVRERDALLLSAPHMVRELPTVIPITSVFSGAMNAATSFFGWSGKPKNRGALPIKLGLGLYDWVSRKRRILPTHRFHSASATRAIWPKLTNQARFSAVYYDAWISHPERLCIEMITDMGEAAPESIALNYAELQVENGENDRYVVEFSRTGERVPVTTDAIVNATGAWLDSTIQSLGGNTDEQMVSGTKGSHLILDNQELGDALKGHMVYFENTDGRVCIAFPYLGHVLAGSTDIRVDEVTKVRCEKDEQSYILSSLRMIFPDVPVSPDQVVFSYSGIRPLPKSKHDFTGRISRGHFIKRLGGPVPQFCMIGGKWTTFRAFAEQTADEVLNELNLKRKCNTLGLPIGGGDGFDAEGTGILDRLTGKQGLPAERAAHLVGHYGTDAEIVHQFCSCRDKDSSIGEGSQYTRAEITHLIRDEQVETLSDLVLRRTSLGITGAISAGLIESLSELLAKELKLSASDIAQQRETLIQELEDFYGVMPEVLKERSHSRRMLCD